MSLSAWQRRAAPPEALTSRQWRVLALLVLVAIGIAYQGSIPSVSITYAARELGFDTDSQATALAWIRGDIVLGLLWVHLADRVGRRRMLLATAALGPLGTAACALMPSLGWFTVSQIVARSFVTAAAILIAVIGVEVMPSASRTWASGVLIAAAATGSATAAGAVFFADHGTRTWRLLYLVPLLSLAVLPLIARRLPESDRFVRAATRPGAAQMAATLHGVRRHWRRLVVVSVFLALLAFENAPARQLQNDYLRVERGYSARMVSVFSLMSNAPGVIGLAVGATLAHRIGNRRLLGWTIAGFGVFDAAMFLAHGPWIWVWSSLGALIGAASLPMLGILSAELFPTIFRSTANGITTVASRIGGALGLLLVAVLTRWWSRGTALALTSSAVVFALLLLPALPDTTSKELEVLNPDDAAPPDLAG